MSSTSYAAVRMANQPLAKPFPKTESRLPRKSVNAAVMRVARSLWPTKTDMVLAHKTKASDRMCRYWLENRYSISADDLAVLLQSDEGFKILEAVIGETARPVWWVSFRKQVLRGELLRQQAELAKQLEETDKF